MQNLSQLRVSINDESHFDNPLKFRWECTAGKPTAMELRTIMITTSPATCVVTTWFRSSLEKLTETEIPITAADYCNHYFMIPINLNLDRHVDNEKTRATFPLTISLQK